MDQTAAKIRHLYLEASKFSRESPAPALNSARKAAEGICHLLARRAGLATSGELDKLIATLSAGNAAPIWVVASLRTIQYFGNVGSHFQPGSEGRPEAITPCLAALGEVMLWLCEELQLAESVEAWLGENPRRAYGTTDAETLMVRAVEELAGDLSSLATRAVALSQSMARVVGNGVAIDPVPLGSEWLLQRLGEDADARGNAYFHLDDRRALRPFTPEMLGNLTGEGGLSSLEGSRLREAAAALRLGDWFQAANSLVGDVAWAYYTSASGFIYIHPWKHSLEKNFVSATPDLRQHHFFAHGRPEVNPDRRAFWCECYEDAYGKGRMVTVAAPVDHDGDFLGTTALDITLSAIERAARIREVPRVTLEVRDASGQTLASVGAREAPLGIGGDQRPDAEAGTLVLDVAGTEDIHGKCWTVRGRTASS